MTAKLVFSSKLSDDELRHHLERGDTLAFKGLALKWQAVERQVERLGFADAYFVSQTKGPHGETIHVAPARG
jgi:hypothetical protein